MIVYLQDILNNKAAKNEKRENLVKCECGCSRVFASSQMVLVGNGNGGYDLIYRLHHNQIWGNRFGNLQE